MTRKLVAADLSSAEVRIFAHFSGDERLQAVFPRGEDIYSRVAIDVYNRPDLSAHPDDPNFLKKVEPQLRQDVKAFVLGVVYGSSGFQVAASLNLLDDRGRVDSAAGQKLIDKYLSTYPNLRKYMIKQELAFKKHGYVQTPFGRVRRFDEAHALYKKYGDRITDSRWAKQNGLEVERGIVKKALNAAKNFPIQSSCASIVNMAMIEMGQWLETSKADCNLVLQCHDEIVYECDESITDIVSSKLKFHMESNKFAKMMSVPFIANPVVADNLAEAK